MAKMKFAELPKEWDIESEIYTFRFYLMLKMRCGITKYYDRYLKDLRTYLQNQFGDNKAAVSKMTEKITSRAYLSIPESFWTNIEKGY